MFSKSLMALAVAGAMFSGSAFAVVAPTPISLTNISGTNDYTGSFSVNSGNDIFSINFPSGLSNLTAGIVSIAFPGFYTPTSVIFDTTYLSPTHSSNPPFFQSWSYNLNNIASGVHTLTVTGTGAMSGFGGVQFTNIPAVPEPSTIAMMLAGLALVGGLQLRGKNKTSQLAG